MSSEMSNAEARYFRVERVRLFLLQKMADSEIQERIGCSSAELEELKSLAKI